MKFPHSLLVFSLFLGFCRCSVGPDSTRILEVETTLNEVSKIEEPTSEWKYPYETKLSGGYEFKVDSVRDNHDVIQVISLFKDSFFIKEINSTSFGLPFKNLGYIGADFQDEFALVQSFGSGNPHHFQLIEKKTGAELLIGYFVDADEKEEVILFVIRERGKEISDKLVVYDINNERFHNSIKFDNSTCVSDVAGGLRYCVKIKEVSNEEITLASEYENEKLIEVFSR